MPIHDKLLFLHFTKLQVILLMVSLNFFNLCWTQIDILEEVSFVDLKNVLYGLKQDWILFVALYLAISQGPHEICVD